MKVSLITPCFNSSGTIERTLKSVGGQTYAEIEHIIVDGASIDNTIDLVRQYDHVSKVISEEDEGIYDAFNKGIRAASGDIIGILNSDDCFSDPEVVSRVVESFKSFPVDSIYGDVRYVNPKNPDKTIRYYSSKKFHPKMFSRGYMPPHASFYAKRELFNQYGFYHKKYKIAGDFELIMRFLKVNGVSCKYIPLCIVDMFAGGVSNRSLKMRFLLNQEILIACRDNNIYSNWFMVLSKYLSKVFEFRI